MIVGLCSTYREGRLAESAVRSLLPAVDRVIVLDGPIGDAPPAGPETDWRRIKDGRVLVKRGAWRTDAEKRTAMLGEAKAAWAHWNTASTTVPLWGVILDGDELLLHGEVLPEYFDAIHPDALGFSLHLMELDGSCSYIPNRVLRLNRISSWAISSYAFVVDGITVSKPNVKILAAGEPDVAERVNVGDAMRQRRRPLAGEPHILHRSVLRSPERQQVQRQHMAEAEQFAQLAQGQPVGDAPKPDGVPIWLPGH